MDDARFDTLTRTLAVPSRRAVLSALGIAVAAALFRSASPDETPAKRKHRASAASSRRHDRDQLNAERRRRHRNRGNKHRNKKKPKPPTPPSCLAHGESCLSDGECCSEDCFKGFPGEGFCRGSEPPPPPCLPHGESCLGDGDCCSEDCFDPGFGEPFCRGLDNGARCRVDGQCASGGCVYGMCVSLSAGCGPETVNTYCVEDDDSPHGATRCPDTLNDWLGYCAQTDDGPFCANAIMCNSDGTDICETDAGCALLGEGPHVRCVHNCNNELTNDLCGVGVNACVEFYVGGGSGNCVPAGFPCTSRNDCCYRAPCVADQFGTQSFCLSG